ncbi:MULTISPECIES: septum formation family protein [unclassified Solwaraspora]|uniref:septum formation family protein n=1 Tax=unclassified Solwaraspora TaxID=2627926 RepID=UPI00259B4417|nr:septum formation family protein [Solwaraspora sp. WMMA2056]WJK39272.1 septum formation family protein [Solwaraspora sp. WMMA2056]
MRRRWIRLLLAVTVLTAAAGCGLAPRTAGGELTDGWAVMPTPKPFVPDVGACHPVATNGTGHRDDYTPVTCDRPHDLETVFVGIFTGTHAVSDRAPAHGSAARRVARHSCDQRVRQFLGDDWQAGRVRLDVVVPSTAAWSGGARWYRCDVGEMTSMQDRSLVTRTGSLAGALGPDGPLRWGCFNPGSVSGGDVDVLTPVACTQPHRSEFAGLYVESDLPYDQFAANSDRVHERCRQVVAEYAALPVDDDLRYRVGTIYDYPFKDEWDDGNLTVRCLLWRDDPPLTRSVRDGGPAALPVRQN